MTVLRTIAMQIAGMALLAGVLAWTSASWAREHPVWSDARAISYAEAVALGQQALWIDARSDEQYRQAHWPGAVHLTERAWDVGMERFLAAWQPGQTIVIYCDSGGCRTSQHVAAHLERDVGVPTRVVIGGWGELQRHHARSP